MLLPTTIELADTFGRPRIRKDFPGPLRIGDRIKLGFRLGRVNQGRHEVLEVKGDFKVSSVSFDGTEIPRQLIQVEAVGKEPTWRAVKKPPAGRQVAPARFPPTVVV